jgi:hypothetical protein
MQVGGGGISLVSLIPTILISLISLVIYGLIVWIFYGALMKIRDELRDIKNALRERRPNP